MRIQTAEQDFVKLALGFYDSNHNSHIHTLTDFRFQFCETKLILLEVVAIHRFIFFMDFIYKLES